MKRLITKGALALAALGLSMTVLPMSVALAQTFESHRPAFTGLADRISERGTVPTIDAGFMSLSDPMYVDEALPPRRPAPRMTLVRSPNRAPTPTEILSGRPPEAPGLAPRRNSLCASERCPHLNMIGIQY